MNKLKEIRKLNNMINHKIAERDEIFTLLTKVNAYEMNPDKVQSSSSNDRHANLIVKLVEIEDEVDDIIDEYVDKKMEIIKLLGELIDINDGKYYEVLYKKYVEFKSIRDIAIDMGYSYQYIRMLHGEALKIFFEKSKLSTK